MTPEAIEGLEGLLDEVFVAGTEQRELRLLPQEAAYLTKAYPKIALLPQAEGACSDGKHWYLVCFPGQGLLQGLQEAATDRE